MPVTIEAQNTGDTNLQRDLAARIEQVFANRPGDWRIVILGSKASDRWDLKITGPNAFERSYTLEGALGQHEPIAVAAIICRMLRSRN